LTLRFTLIVLHAGVVLALLVSLARLLAVANFDHRRKIVVSGRRPLALASYDHRRKIAVSGRSNFDHRRKIVVSGRWGMLLVVVLLVVLPMGRGAAGLNRRKVVTDVFAHAAVLVVDKEVLDGMMHCEALRP
jgi:hypothetical protein